jgi:CRP/FNR family transcriptional regulator, anaerobic regulatory protein
MGAHDLDDAPLLRGLSSATRVLLAERGIERSYDVGSVIWRAGDVAHGIYIVLEGRVRAVREHDGREVVVHRSGPGATLGEIPLFDGRGYPATLRAETRARLLFVDRRLLEHVLERDAAVAWRLLETLGGRVRELARRLESVAAGSVGSRLATYLLSRAGGGDGVFTLGMTQEALSSELGTVREVVARALGELVAEGVLARVGRARYRVLDRKALERRAVPS